MSAGHVAPKSMYYMVFMALMVGTILTVAAAKFDMGPLNNIVMLTIACTKATLVILFSLGMADYMSRGWIQGTLR